MKPNEHGFSWSADRWIALSAIIIAICSLILSIWQGVVIRQHNRVSVRPILTISGTHNDKGSGWLLGNAGLGPALVKWIEVTVDGKPIRHWREFGAELGLPPDFAYSYWVPAPATVIPPQEPKPLFWVLPGEADKILRSTSKRITIRICYSSIYGECWLASGSPNSPAFLPCDEEPRVHFEPPPFR
jgi:hypothetical protein